MTLFAARNASANVCATDPNCFVAFVHGTGDQQPGHALTDYWTHDSICQMMGWSSGCTLPDWVRVIDYMGASCDATGRTCTDTTRTGGTCSGCDTACSVCSSGNGSWQKITDDIASYMAANSWATKVAIVTHSNGINPIRYMLTHTTYNTANYNGTGHAVSTVTNALKEIVAIAGSMKGTPLADKVTTSGTLASFANGILDLFGNGYNNAAVKLQRTDNMALGNANGWFGNSTTSIPIQTIHGTSVSAAIWSSDAWCGGYAESVGLKAALCYGWGCGGSSDGFIGSDSATYTGTDINNQGVTNASHLNHNSSRRSCVGSGNAVSWAINNWNGVADPTYTVSQAVLACNSTTTSFIGGSYQKWGCSGGAAGAGWNNDSSDTTTDYDCYAAYGEDNGNSATPGTSTETVGSYTYNVNTGYSGTFYGDATKYGNGGAGCSDSWLGDGTCDVCLLAKYGYDAIPGSAGGTDDCKTPAASAADGSTSMYTKGAACTSDSQCTTIGQRCIADDVGGACPTSGTT
jgi:hypothetical protein